MLAKRFLALLDNGVTQTRLVLVAVMFNLNLAKIMHPGADSGEECTVS